MDHESPERTGATERRAEPAPGFDLGTRAAVAQQETAAVPDAPALSGSEVEAARVPEPETPRLAEVRPVRTIFGQTARAWIVGVVAVIGVAYLLFGTVLARNVTYNIMSAIDPGSSSPLRRYQRQSIVSIWHTMVHRAPDFGSVPAMQVVLVVSAVVFVVAAIALCYVAFVPSEEAWASDIGMRRDGAADPRDE